MTQFVIAHVDGLWRVSATEDGIDRYHLAEFRSVRDAIRYSDTLDSPAEPVTAEHRQPPADEAMASSAGTSNDGLAAPRGQAAR